MPTQSETVATGHVSIAVLFYVNRSGSTLLSRLISEHCAGVFVFPDVGSIIDLLLSNRAGRRAAGRLSMK